MRRLKTVFRKSDTSNTATSRHLWQRRTPVKHQAETTTTETCDEPTTDTAPSSTENKPTQSSAVAPAGNNVAQADPIPQAEDTSELPRSKFGTASLKKMVARFRSSNSQEDDPITHETQPKETSETGIPRENPVGGPLSSNPSGQPDEIQDAPGGQVARPGSGKDVCDPSGPTSHSRGSSKTEDTVCQHPPNCPHPPEERISSMSLNEDVVMDEWILQTLAYNIPEEGARIREFSDPFSDGKGLDFRQPGSGERPESSGSASEPIPGPSKRSSYHSRDDSRASEGPLEPIPETEADITAPSHTIDEIVADAPQRAPLHVDTQKSSRMTDSTGSQDSQASKSSTVTLDAPKAIITFNRIAAQHGIHVNISLESIASPRNSPTLTPATSSIQEEEEASNRRGLFSRVRKVRSNLDPVQPPAPKLRRMKTFANLRRATPLTSLRGKSIETLARLGGHSYIVSKELGPSPLQLPACMVAAFTFLHRYGPNHPLLFIQPGDLKAAIHTYDGWAKDVLDAEKIKDEIDLTTRVVAMPRFGEHSVPVLSVGWALRALLAGLPKGILGSVRLYQTLQNLFAITTPEETGFKVPSNIPGVSSTVAVRVQLISLAVIGLCTEMQRDLLCTLFGLLTILMCPKSTIETQRSQGIGIDLREPEAPPDYHELARVFGPILLGQQSRRGVRSGIEEVERELEESRVASMLLDHWPHVNQQLRFWSRDSYLPGRA